MVRATFSGFNTALSALQANQKRLDITGQNLSNMNTAGYTRQQLEASSLIRILFPIILMGMKLQ